MRIGLFVDQLFYKIPGGIGTYVEHLVRELGRLDHEDSYCLFHTGTAGSVRIPGGGFTERKLPGGRRALGLGWHSLGLPRVEWFTGHLDLVHAPGLVIPASAAPLVVTVHDLCVVKFPQWFPKRWQAFHRRGLDLALKFASAILVDSESTYSDMLEMYPGSGKRMRVIPLGVEASRRPDPERVKASLHRLGISGEFALCVGTLEPRKNLPRLIEAFGQVPGERTLVLTGAPGWDYEEVLQAARRAGDRVKLTGYVGPLELEALFAGATCFAYPSLYEGFGLPVLEAMARGVPVLTSNISSLAEVGEGACLMVDPADTEAIAAGLQDLFAEAALRERLRAAGTAKAATYTWDKTARATLEAYREVVA